VVVMNEGKVIQAGTPQAVYAQPASPFVARFLGLDNLLPGSARRKQGRTVVETSLGEFPASSSLVGDVMVLIRPNAARLNRKGEFEFEARLIERSFRGTICRAAFEIGNTRLTFEFHSDVTLPQPGQTLVLSLDPSTGIQVFQ